MRTYTQIRVLDRCNAWQLAEQHWPGALLATVDDCLDAAARRQPIKRHVEVFSDLVAPSHVRVLSIDQIARITEFARQLKPTDRLPVHYAAGISRSTGSALIVASTQGRDPATAFRSLLRIRPQAEPNPLLLLHPDELLHGSRPTLVAVWHAWASAGRRRVPPSTREALSAAAGWTCDRWFYEIGGRTDPPADAHRS